LLSDRQATQFPFGSQSFAVGCEAQSAFVRQATHDEVLTMQNGVVPEHIALVVQPARHTKSCGSQMGLAVPQSVLERHSTHWPSGSWHRGCVEGQSRFVAHSTHCCVVGSQIFIPAGQSDAVRHPTQTPLPEDVSQMGASIGQGMVVVQAGWQV
jgi:hypothetical protein